MFETTNSVIEETEAHIVGIALQNRTLSVWAKTLWFPLQYSWLGLKEFFKPAAVWIWILMGLWFVVFLVGKSLSVPKEVWPIALNACFFSSLFLVVFAMPSTYAFSGVTHELVKKVVVILEKNGVDSEAKIELLEDNLEKVAQRIDARVSFYKWLLGAVWAAYLLVLNIEFRFILKLEADELTKALSENLSSFIVMAFFTIAALLLVVGYKKAANVLVKSIEFSCIEYKYQLIRDEKT